MPNTIQRNAIVAPFQVNTPLVDQNHIKRAASGKPETSVSGVTRPQITWLQSLATGLNATAQITATIPTSSASPGQPGTIAFDSNWLYVCVGLNIWRRTALSAF